MTMWLNIARIVSKLASQYTNLCMTSVRKWPGSSLISSYFPLHSLFPPWFTAFIIKNNCAENHCFINFSIIFHILEFEICILVLNTWIDTEHIILCIIVSRWCRGAGSVYPETLYICKKSPSWPFSKLVTYAQPTSTEGILKSCKPLGGNLL